MKKTIFIVALVSLGLSACKSTPVDPAYQKELVLQNDVTSTEVLESTPQGKERLDKVRFMSQNLMSYSDRKEFKKGLEGEVASWNPTNTALGFAASSAITGNPFSTRGSATAVSVTFALNALSFVLDGSAEKISQLWLPARVDGVEITSELMAQEVAFQQVEDVLENTVLSFGYELQYLGSISKEVDGEKVANSRGHIYNAVVTDATREVFDANKDYPHAPERLMFLVGDHPYKKIEKPDPLQTLVLGFEPAYESLHNGASITILGGTKKDENGNPVVKTVQGFSYNHVELDLWMSALGRDMYRVISGQMPWVQGEDENNRRLIVAGGEAYTFYSTSPDKFISGRFEN
jgi:hypothetical protein